MAKHSHKRDTHARLLFSRVPRVPRATVVAGPLAVLATASAVSLGVLTADVGIPSATSASSASLAGALPGGSGAGDPTSSALDLAGDLDRRLLTRSSTRGAANDVADQVGAIQAKRDRLTPVEKALRPKQVRQAIRGAELEQFTTEVLNLWTEPGDAARQTGELDAGKKVLLTGRSMLGREEIVLGDSTRWVTSGYFSDEKPDPEPTLGGACTNGTSVASGVSPNIVAVHQAVCANFPSITTYGTFRSDGEHAQGIAVDIMVSGEEGYAVAEFVRANASALGVSYLIYAQRIWSVERASEGWRAMSDRGSITANHYDHVHVTTY